MALKKKKKRAFLFGSNFLFTEYQLPVEWWRTRRISCRVHQHTAFGQHGPGRTGWNGSLGVLRRWELLGYSVGSEKGSSIRPGPLRPRFALDLYSQPSMTAVQHFIAHGANPIRGLSFGPTDSKFASCSDDSTVSYSSKHHRFVSQPAVNWTHYTWCVLRTACCTTTRANIYYSSALLLYFLIPGICF